MKTKETMENNDIVRLGQTCWVLSENKIYPLERDGSINTLREVKLTQKQWELLHCLYNPSKEPVSKEKIINTIWPSQAISPESLPQIINKTRKSIYDSEKNVIQHLRNVGYILNHSAYLNTNSIPVETELIDEKDKLEQNIKKSNSLLKEKTKLAIYYSLIFFLTISSILLSLGIYERKIKRQEFLDIHLNSDRYDQIISESDGEILFRVNGHICRFSKSSHEVNCEKE